VKPCPACAGDDTEVVLVTEKVPLQIGMVWPSSEAAIRAPGGEVRLACCHACGFLYNAAFVPDQVSYQPGYQVSLSHSPTYRAFLREEALRLVRDHGILNSTVLEIGSGDGHFLRLICQLGENDGHGFDPSLPTASEERQAAGRVGFYPREHGPADSGIRPDLLVIRSVLELIPSPADFLRSLTAFAGVANAGMLIYAEVPNAAWILESRMAWNIHYEHCSYFTEQTLGRLFAAVGWRVLACEPCYADGQYLRLVGRHDPAARQHPVALPAGILTAAREFGESYARALSGWTRRLAAAKSAGLRIALWGAGGRGSSFLAAVDPGRSYVDFAVDVNPSRQGSFLPVSGHPVHAPEALRDSGCDITLISNATYEEEICAAARALGFTGEVWVI
jgi:hypothetical protein